MKHFFKVFLIAALLVSIEIQSHLARLHYFKNRFTFGQSRQVSIDEFIESLKLEDRQRKLRDKEEKERRIYKHYLANRIKSSIVRDFLTMRYLKPVDFRSNVRA